jgi:TPR repeat protein
MRPYLSSDKLALDTELKYAKCIRLQMGGYWDEIAKLYLIIANRGHPTAQVHLGKQYVHGNGVEEDYVEAYKWFSLSETAIGKHFIEVISEDMSNEQIKKAKNLVKNFKPVYE